MKKWFLRLWWKFVIGSPVITVGQRRMARKFLDEVDNPPPRGSKND